MLLNRILICLILVIYTINFLESDAKCTKDYAKFNYCGQQIFSGMIDSLEVIESRRIEKNKQDANCSVENSIFRKIAQNVLMQSDGSGK